MIKMNKRWTVLLRIFGILLSVWLLLTLIWFAWSRIFFSGYCNEMKPNEFSNIITPRYYKNDEQYTYFVKYPDYLSTTGNMAVSARNDEAGVQAFLIWPTLFGEQKFGLIIADETGSYQISTDIEGKPIDASYREITEKYSSEIADIVAAANDVWSR